MTVASVALPRGPRQVLSYAIPPGLDGRVAVGSRVLVPLGAQNRRCTGYVVGIEGGNVTALKSVADLLDELPLFDDKLLALYEFTASYYRAPLGDVIRCGLPRGLDFGDARRAALTDAGRGRALLDPLLARLSGGERPIKSLGVPVATLLRLEQQGLLTLRYELEKPAVAPRWVARVAATGEEPERRLKDGAGPAQLLTLLRTEGPVDVPALQGRIPSHGAAVRRLVELGAARIERTQVYRDPWHRAPPTQDSPPPLNARQTAAVAAIRAAMDAPRFEGMLLRGVTGSGKTEVYLAAISHALEAGRSGIVLVPEIALTPQLAGRFRARFGDRVAILHSGLADGERLDQWELIRRGERPCVVGARSALFAPVPRLGVIVVDEEHDPSFKQDEAPRYHARDLALKRGLDSSCPVILGSATPSLESVANVSRRRLTRLDLPERIGDRPLPEVTLVDLREHPPVRPEALLSAPLLDALRETVARREQAIIFLNRRGFAAFFLCGTCGYVPECTSCSISLTYHRAQRRLVCHYCGYQSGVPTACPSCRGASLDMVGTGTEQVEAVLAEVLPEARIARMDRDTTRGEALLTLLERFRDGDIDVLVGTQMVTKGHDFPQVTLVGVLLAEQLLKLPDFRSSERTFQLLTQVAGRAGRHALPGRVLVQTFDPDHHSLQCALRHDVEGFVAREERQRRMRGFPPYSRLALLRLDDVDPIAVRDAAGRVARRTREALLDGNLPVDVIGPQLAAIERIKGRTRYQVLLRSADRAALHSALDCVEALEPAVVGGVRLIVDVDPVSLL